MGEYAAEYPHSTRAYAAATIDFMRESVDAGKPFCMCLFYKAPHEKFEADPMFDDVYKDTVWQRPENFGREAGLHFAEQSRGGRQVKIFKDLYEEDETYQEIQRVYHQLIYGIDYSVGMIRDELERLGIADNTVIIFSSDNGYYQGAHGFGGKVLPYEEGTRAPLIIYDPRSLGTGKKRRTESLTGNVDLAATIADWAGADIPDVYDGKSLMPIVRDASAEIRHTLPLIQVWGAEKTRCLSIVSKDYKYVHWYYDEPVDELYHLANDPFEMTNLSANPEYAPVLKKLQRAYDEQVAHWQAESVEHNGYREYGLLLDRNVDWDQKSTLLGSKPSAEGQKAKKSQKNKGASGKKITIL